MSVTNKTISLLQSSASPNTSISYSRFIFIFRKKNDTNVKDIKELQGRYQIIDKENKFIITNPDVYDAGKYSCSIPELDAAAEINVVGKWKKLCKIYNFIFAHMKEWM